MPKSIRELIAEIDALLENTEPRKHPRDGYSKHFIGNLEVWTCPSCGLEEQWNVFYDGKSPICTRKKERRELRNALKSNYESLRRAALKGEAGERVVEAVKESRDVIGSSWKLAEAMSAYRSAVGEE